MKKLLITFLFAIIITSGFSQNVLPKADSEFLNKKFAETIKSNSDEKKKEINSEIVKKVKTILSGVNSYQYDFKEIRNIGCIESDDKKVKIITWNLFLTDNQYSYFGFILKKDNSKTIVSELNDNPQGIRGLRYQSLPVQNWYGCLYYKVITKKYKGNIFYTLLGWDGNFRQVKRRYIDVLTFANNIPTLGKSIFETKKGMMSREIFNFSQKASFILKYEDKNKRIICDRLAPLRRDQERDYRHYYPIGSIMDAYKFKKGKWVKVYGIKNR